MEPWTLILITITVCIVLYYFLLHKSNHFERLKISHVRPIPILGNMAAVVFQRMSTVELHRKIYNGFPNVKYYGFYDFVTPIYMIRDLELINSITIKNFDYFSDHNNFINEKVDPIAGRNLFGMKGDQWREMRKILSPSFTLSKMKLMFELINECAENLSNHLAVQSKNGKEYEMKDTMTRYANDVVATCAFGINVDSMKYPNNEFLLLGRKVLSSENRSSFQYYMNIRFPSLSKLLGLRMFSDEIENFLKGIVSETVRLRKEKNIVRPDMIQLMLESLSKDNKSVNIDEMTAQAFVFFLGGFDSVSTSMSFLVHEVGVNSDIQSKLQAEIDDVIRQTNGKPTYEAINGMRYLDAVVNETLRLYPLGAFLDRVCVKNFKLPPATPDSEPVTLKPGDTIWIPNYALHLDPKYFPNPEKFDPNRFLEGNVDNAIYMPFGMGPRICIANRFSLLESKIMLFHLLSRCDVEPTSRTKIPMMLGKKSFIMTAEGGFWLRLRTRKLTRNPF